MPRATSKPGPCPTSCITCRRRRKKCDLSKPCCKRCLKGGLECLGYEESKLLRRTQLEDPIAPSPSHSECTISVNQAETTRSGELDSPTTGLSEGWQDPTISHTDHNPGPLVLGAALLYNISRPISSTTDSCAYTDASGRFDDLWPQEQNLLAIHPQRRTRKSSCVQRLFDTTPRVGPTRSHPDVVIRDMYQSIPPAIDTTQILRQGYLVQVISEYHVRRSSYWFKIPSPTVRSSLVAQLIGSKRTTWVMYLGARIFQALAQGPLVRGSIVQGYIGWIDKLDRRFTIDSRVNPPLRDVVDRLRAQLELAFFKFTFVDNSSGYTLLGKAVPMILQLVAANPNLYMERSNGCLIVSFSRALSAPRYEIRRFVVYDTIASLVLGVPPLVEYGYPDEADSSSFGFEWVHGIPAGLIGTISQINSWRAGSRNVLGDWQTLERHVLAWRPHTILNESPDTESVDTVRAAVQESWRHVALIYIYMGICGVSSHDSRVQTSVTQIALLVKSTADLPIGVHTLAHCVIAGIAARLETHRVLVYNMLLSFDDTRVWLFRGPQFSQALYHLWRGVGEGGSPIFWGDYVRSRSAVMPI